MAVRALELFSSALRSALRFPRDNRDTSNLILSVKCVGVIYHVHSFNSPIIVKKFYILAGFLPITQCEGLTYALYRV